MSLVINERDKVARALRIAYRGHKSILDADLARAAIELKFMDENFTLTEYGKIQISLQGKKEKDK